LDGGTSSNTIVHAVAVGPGGVGGEVAMSVVVGLAPSGRVGLRVTVFEGGIVGVHGGPK
jgi:hypothetical protein